MTETERPADPRPDPRSPVGRRARAGGEPAEAVLAGQPPRAVHARARARAALAFGLILLVGLGVRASWPLDDIGPAGGARPAYGQLPGDVPFGLHPDEGHNALDAWRIATEGWRPVFLERNNGREPLFIYLMAACMALLGPTIQAARSAGAIAGAAAIAAQLVLVRALPLERPTRVALLSAACVAFSFWPIAQARYALRANLLPVWVALMLWAWWKAVGGSSAAAGATSDDGTEGPRRRSAAAGRTATSSATAPARDRAGTPKTGLAWTSIGWAALAGLFVGLAVHTHLTGRALPAILAASALWVARRERRARALFRLALALAVAGAVAWPQIDYFRKHPELFGHRADQVSVLNPDVNEGDLPGTLSRNAWNLIATPLLAGDTSWYHNLRGRPVFDDPVSAGAFLVGLGVLASWALGRRGRAARSAAVLLGATLAVTALPSLLSVGAPNSVRLTGTWPVLFLVPALGLDAVARWIEPKPGRREGTRDPGSDATPPAGEGHRRFPAVPGGHRRWPAASGPSRLGRLAAGARTRRLAALAVLWLAPAWLLQDSARDYFAHYVGRPEVYMDFNGAAVERGQALAALPLEPLYVSPGLWNQAVIRFLVVERAPSGVFDSREGLVLPPAAGPVGSPAAPGAPAPRAGARYAFDPSEAEQADAFAARWPESVREDVPGREDRPSAGAANLIVLTLSADAIDAIVRGATAPIPRATFGPNLTLDRLGISDAPSRAGAGGTVAITLLWTALAPTAIDHNFFVRLKSDVDGRTIASFDGPPLGGSFPTDRWAAGERILMPLEMAIADDAPAGPATLVHGWYDWRDGRRLSLVEGPRAPGEVDAAVIGRLEVGGR